MMTRIRMEFVCLALLSATGLAVAQEAAPEAGVVAIVNGEKLFFEDVERQLQALHAGQSEVQREAFDLDRLLLRMVNEALIAQEARALGMHEEDPIPQRLEERRLEMARQKLETEEIWQRIEVSDEEVRQAFFESYESVTFRLLTAEDRDTASRLRARLDEDTDFAAVVAEFTAEAPGFRDRVYESVPRVDVPSDIEAAAFALQPGQISGPFRTNLGWSIVRVERFEAAVEEEFPKYEKRIRELTSYRRADRRRRELAQRLRDSFEVTVDSDAADVGCERLSDGRLMPQVERPDAIVATAGSRVITAEAFGGALRKRWRTMTNREAALASRPLILERLIDHELMNAEAMRRGYDGTPEVDRAVSSYLTELLVPRYLSEVLAPSIKVSEDEKRAYYDENRERFRRLPRVKLGQVTVESAEEAERVVELLRQNADLAWVAKNHSIDRFKSTGGDRGWIVPTVALGELQQVVAEAEPGTVIGPLVEDDGSYLVLRVDAREEQGYYTLDEVSGNVREGVYARKFAQALEDLISQLRAESEINVDAEAVAALQLSGSRASSAAAHPRMTEGDGE